MSIKVETYWYFGQFCKRNKLGIKIPSVGYFWIGMSFKDLSNIVNSSGQYPNVRRCSLVRTDIKNNRYDLVDSAGGIVLSFKDGTAGIECICCDNISKYLTLPNCVVHIDKNVYYSSYSINNSLLWIKNDSELKLLEKPGVGTQVSTSIFKPYPKFTKARCDSQIRDHALAVGDIHSSDNCYIDSRSLFNEFETLKVNLRNLQNNIVSLKDKTSNTRDKISECESQIDKLKKEYNTLYNDIWHKSFEVGARRYCFGNLLGKKVIKGSDGLPVLDLSTNTLGVVDSYDVCYAGQRLSPDEYSFVGGQPMYTKGGRTGIEAEFVRTGSRIVHDDDFDCAARLFENGYVKKILNRLREIPDNIKSLNRQIEDYRLYLSSQAYNNDWQDLVNLVNNYNSLYYRYKDLCTKLNKPVEFKVLSEY